MICGKKIVKIIRMVFLSLEERRPRTDVGFGILGQMSGVRRRKFFEELAEFGSDVRCPKMEVLRS